MATHKASIVRCIPCEAFIGEMRALDRFAKEKKVISRERQEPKKTHSGPRETNQDTCTFIPAF